MCPPYFPSLLLGALYWQDRSQSALSLSLGVCGPWKRGSGLRCRRKWWNSRVQWLALSRNREKSCRKVLPSHLHRCRPLSKSMKWLSKELGRWIPCPRVETHLCASSFPKSRDMMNRTCKFHKGSYCNFCHECIHHFELINPLLNIYFYFRNLHLAIHFHHSCLAKCLNDRSQQLHELEIPELGSKIASWKF